MATLVLGAVGSALGGTVGGGVGAVLGKAAGAFLGNALDQHLFGETAQTHHEGSRLKNLEVQTSTEGAPLPVVFGKVRLSGQVIWATRFEEVKTTTRHESGGKGGGGGRPKQVQTTTTYKYYANLAIGLCEGPIARIGRVWADGKPFNPHAVTMRTYLGTHTQSVDPLIAAKEAHAPAFRGTAYVVFERLPLEAYGNRLPQFSFEVTRQVGGMEDEIQAVTIIPGATEFGYHPQPVLRTVGLGVTQRENTHTANALSDWQEAIDQLQALCPNLKRVGLVVSWFGTSLAAGDCRIEPKIERREKTTSIPWSVAGLTRQTANLVSEYNQKPAFGSSPDDSSVRAAIADLRARGLKVTLIPFIMMDVPADNMLPDPWNSGAHQPAYPWRGRVTVSPAADQPGSVDKTSQAAQQVSSFVGSQLPSATEWSFRRFILHIAGLAKDAGGVDAFLIGSEMRGLTTVRDEAGDYPFVNALVDLAADIRAIVGPSTMLTYGADWSEYSNHVPSDGSGDVVFHLDPLWASPNIDVIGIDQYQPITDWRYAEGHLDASLGDSPYDKDVIEAGLSGGENHDWYYASQADRDAQVRTPISDTAYNEPWIYRSKDLVSWWSNPHHNRLGGIRQAQPTAFVPKSKPIWLTEFGAPAVDLAGNQPSAFPSDKPDNSTLPIGSRGIRDDAQQRAILETALGYWGAAGSDNNPISPLYGGAMLDPSAIHIWTWDARPYPVFPSAISIWSDGVNWSRGHWLNGRLGAGSLGDVLRALCDHFQLPQLSLQSVHGTIDGYSLPEPITARAALADLSAIYGLDVVPTASGTMVKRRTGSSIAQLGVEDIVEPASGPLITVTREDPQTIPQQMTLGFTSLSHGYRTGVVRSQRLDGIERPDAFRSVAITLNPEHALKIVERLHHEKIAASQSLSFALPPSFRDLEPGDVVDLDFGGQSNALRLCIKRIVDGTHRTVEAYRVDPAIYGEAADLDEEGTVELPAVFGPPDIIALDLPAEPNNPNALHNVKLAVFADPWPGAVDVYSRSDEQDFAFAQAVDAPATTGKLVDALPPGPVTHIHRGVTVVVDVPTGALSAVTQEALLNGANLAAIAWPEGLEVIQFADAQLIDEGQYRLRGLIRGLGGTEAAAMTGAPENARFVMLDGTLVNAQLSALAVSNTVTLRAEPEDGIGGAFTRTELDFTALPRSLQPLAPVHPRAQRLSNGALVFSWVRRARGVSDSWELSSVPLQEESEAYEISVVRNGDVLRQAHSLNPAWTYSYEHQMSDEIVTPAGLADVTIEVSQIGTGGRVGERCSIPIGI